MIRRNIEKEVILLAKEFPVIVINGPRQSGKTTLSQYTFPNHQYVSLEDPDNREFALDDPRGFLNKYDDNVIIDEAQHAPELFSYLQLKADESQKMGKFILTGSQNYLLLEKISQSLAGRVGIVTLLPFSINELESAFPKLQNNSNKYIYTGSYPPVYDRGIRPASFYSAYINTYVERDLRKVFNITDLSRFKKMIKLLAGRVGQLLNKQELAVETGVTHVTIEKWISILEASYIVFRLQPWFRNFNKRIVKQPKIYFYDTGLAAHLLGLRDENDLALHYSRGHLFENMVITEFVKENFNFAHGYNLYFWRDNHKKEIDLIIDIGSKAAGIEIKSSATFRKEFLSTLKYWGTLSNTPPEKLVLIYDGIKEINFLGINIRRWNSTNEILETL